MKYKILVSGNNPALIVDFIQHTQTFFRSVSTTTCRQDVEEHFRLFDPDAYVCFVDSEYSNIFYQFEGLKKDESYNGAAIFLICDAETCAKLNENPVLKMNADLVIRRPISVDNLILRIMRYFDELKSKKAKAEAKAKAEEKAKSADIEAKSEETAAKERAETEKAVKKAERKHILVVDDDRIILKMLKTALSDKYDVTTMVNGITAEKFLETKGADLVILDYEMPIETGADVFRKIKRNPKLSNIPVCFLTGVSEREKIMEVMSLKPHGYLLKPIDMDMLTATISNLTV